MKENASKFMLKQLFEKEYIKLYFHAMSRLKNVELADNALQLLFHELSKDIDKLSMMEESERKKYACKCLNKLLK